MFPGNGLRWRSMLVAGVCTMACARAEAVTPVSFDAFTRLTDEQIASVQCRTTLVGTRIRPPTIVAFVVGDRPVAWEAFEAIERPGGVYSRPYQAAEAAMHRSVSRDTVRSAAEVRAIHDLFMHQVSRVLIDRAAMRALVAAAGSVDAYARANTPLPGSISLAFVAVVHGDTIGFDRLMDHGTTTRVYQTMIDGLRSYPEAICALMSVDELGDLQARLGPVVVTDSVSMEVSGIRRQDASGTYVGLLTVTNTSRTSLAGPVRVVFPMDEGITLRSATERTCVVYPVGEPVVQVSANRLDPGRVSRVVLRFSNPRHEEIRGSPTRVLAGPGIP